MLEAKKTKQRIITIYYSVNIILERKGNKINDHRAHFYNEAYAYTLIFLLSHTVIY